MESEWEKFRKKIANLQSDLAVFKADFVDRDCFKKFCDNLYDNVGVFTDICITGYFSETIREELKKITRI
jgi:hypothetical protein